MSVCRNTRRTTEWLHSCFTGARALPRPHSRPQFIIAPRRPSLINFLGHLDNGRLMDLNEVDDCVLETFIDMYCPQYNSTFCLSRLYHFNTSNTIPFLVPDRKKCVNRNNAFTDATDVTSQRHRHFCLSWRWYWTKGVSNSDTKLWQTANVAVHGTQFNALAFTIENWKKLQITKKRQYI